MEDTGLKAAKLDLMRLINDATDEGEVRQILGQLSPESAPNASATDDLCDEFEKEMLETLFLIKSNPEIFSDPLLRNLAEKTLRVLQGFSATANAKAAYNR